MEVILEVGIGDAGLLVISLDSIEFSPFAFSSFDSAEFTGVGMMDESFDNSWISPVTTPFPFGVAVLLRALPSPSLAAS